jgi:hypothetical protein
MAMSAQIVQIIFFILNVLIVAAKIRKNERNAKEKLVFLSFPSAW